MSLGSTVIDLSCATSSPIDPGCIFFDTEMELLAAQVLVTPSHLQASAHSALSETPFPSSLPALHLYLAYSCSVKSLREPSLTSQAQPIPVLYNFHNFQYTPILAQEPCCPVSMLHCNYIYLIVSPIHSEVLENKGSVSLISSSEHLAHSLAQREVSILNERIDEWIDSQSRSESRDQVTVDPSVLGPSKILGWRSKECLYRTVTEE